MKTITYYKPGQNWSPLCVADMVVAGQLEAIDATKIPEVEGLNLVRDLNQKIKAAEKLCELYFNIAAKAIGEDEVRRQRDEALPKP